MQWLSAVRNAIGWLNRALMFLLFTAMLLATFQALGVSRSMLGVVVRSCAANFALTSSPSPCAKVVAMEGGRSGYVILSEPMDENRTILAPVGDMLGIEDASLLSSHSPNYFGMAWRERAFVKHKSDVQLSRSEIGLAINSRQSRTQDRLHIHMACIRFSVLAALQRHALAIPEDHFRKLDFPLRGTHYFARAIAAKDIDWNPFELVAAGIPRETDSIGDLSIAIVGTVLPGNVDGFYVLADISNPSRNHEAAAERLLDPLCSR